MRILAVSDIHDDETALKAIAGITGNFDYVFIAGDIATTVHFAEMTLSMIPNAFIIPGNNEPEKVIGILEKAENYVHGKRIGIGDGLNVVGFGYSSITPFGTPGELTENEIKKGLEPLEADGNTLLLLHCPPKGYFDKAGGRNAGSNSILEFIKNKKPMAALFGHIHELQGTSMIENTKLIKIPAAQFMKGVSIEIKNKGIEVEFLEL